MPTTKNPGSTKGNESSRKMGGSTSSNSPGNTNRAKTAERGDQNKPQGNQNPKSNR